MKHYLLLIKGIKMSCLIKNIKISLYISQILICSSIFASSGTGNLSEFANAIEALKPPTQLSFNFNIQRNIEPVEISEEILENRVREAVLRTEARISNSNLSDDEARGIIEQEKAMQYAKVEALRKGYSYIIQGNALTYNDMRNVSMVRIDNEIKSQFIFDGKKSAEIFPGSAFIRNESYSYLEDEENPLSWLDKRLTAIKNAQKMLNNAEIDIHVSKDAKGNLSLFANDRLYMSIYFNINGRKNKIEGYSNKGKVSRRIIIENYTDITKDYAFPQNITREVFDYDGNLITREDMTIVDIELDPKIKPADFSIRLEPGTNVTDMRYKDTKGDYKSYQVPDISNFLAETLLDLECEEAPNKFSGEISETKQDIPKQVPMKKSIAISKKIDEAKQNSIKKITANVTDTHKIYSKANSLKVYFLVAFFLLLITLVSSFVFVRRRIKSNV